MLVSTKCNSILLCVCMYMNSRKRRKRVRRKKTRSKKIIKGGARQWKGFTLDSSNDNIERELERYKFVCPYIGDIQTGIKLNRTTLILYGPNHHVAGVVQYEISSMQAVAGQTLILINNLCCWFKALVYHERKYEAKLTEDYSAGQIMMVMTILTFLETYKNCKIRVFAAEGSELYYKSCGFVDKGGNFFTYEIKPDLDMETILSKFTKNYASKSGP
jgi:hypothetical protein